MAHDIHHTVTGFRTELADEVGVLALCLAPITACGLSAFRVAAAQQVT
jgi:ubiquinone biosynthesis protein Coq4